MEKRMSDETKPVPLWRELRRKAFHMLALGYVAALIYLPRPVFLNAIVWLFTIVAGVELARLRSPRLNEWLFDRFGSFFRSDEKHRFSGVFWMLLGVGSAAALVAPLPLAASALLYLILGDGVASLVGMRLGGPHWPRSAKRITGSAACFVACLIIGQTLLRPYYGWSGIVAGALTATVVELGFIPINDNLLIPLASSISFLICYGLKPGAF
jgi:dolichol kinase